MTQVKPNTPEKHIYFNLEDNFIIFKKIIDEISSKENLYPGFTFDRNFNIIEIAKFLDNRFDFTEILLSFVSKEISVGSYYHSEFRDDYTKNVLDYKIDDEKVSWLLLELKDKMDFDGETFETLIEKHCDELFE